MAKKIIEQPKRVKIYSPFYEGYLDEMPQEAKDALIARNPKAAKIFEKQEVI